MSPGVELVSFKPVRKGTLRGFATVKTALMILHDCPVLRHPNGKCWATLAGRPQIDADGRQRVGPGGKKLFVPAAEWRSKEISDRFSAAVLKVLQEAGISLDDGDE